ncbi:hypothetical protein PG994_004880 [Apiospora phragmitis]|uniref:Uncharacterized protein n=1 Tax=Apiospora phragmitis TaxID=2905665 RepID=A0ABR1VRU1_9PEZI
MAGEISTSSTARLAPEKIVWGCTHVSNVSDLKPHHKEIFKCCVLRGLNDPPGMYAYLQNHCHVCLGAQAPVTPNHLWDQLAWQPLKAQDSACKDRVSIMMFFHHIWNAFCSTKCLEERLRSNDPMHLEALSILRLWCKTVTLGLCTGDDPTALTRLLMVIEDLHGPLARQEIANITERYQRLLNPRLTMDQIWPAEEGERGRLFMAQAQAFRDRVRGGRTFPADFTREFNNVCASASAWSGELIGPPQVLDLRLDIVQPEVRFPGEVERLKELIETVNVEAMRFKMQLYVLFRRSRDSEALQDEEQMMHLLDLVEALEKRASLRLLPLQVRLRQEWDTWVEYAMPTIEHIRAEEAAEAVE